MWDKLKSWYRRADPFEVVGCVVAILLLVCLVTGAICATVVMVAETLKYLGGL